MVPGPKDVQDPAHAQRHPLSREDVHRVDDRVHRDNSVRVSAEDYAAEAAVGGAAATTGAGTGTGTGTGTGPGPGEPASAAAGETAAASVTATTATITKIDGQATTSDSSAPILKDINALYTLLDNRYGKKVCLFPFLFSLS